MLLSAFLGFAVVLARPVIPVVALLVGALAAPAGASSPAGAVPRPPQAAPVVRPLLRLVTELHAATDVSGLRVPAILTLVSAIWRTHLDLETGDAGGDDRCAATLTLSLADRPRADPADSQHISPGWIEFVDDEPSSTITVSPRAVHQWVGQQRMGGLLLASLPPGAGARVAERAMAWSIAHEIGHYVLRSKAHGPAGLMKARFNASDVLGHLTSAAREVDPHDLTVPRPSC